MIQAQNLTKKFGPKIAVNDVSFQVEPGRVTGFLGPNGAGKSTTMRMIVGLDRPTGGQVTVNGKNYAEHANPLFEVGALLDAKSAHPGRTARNHLRVLAATHGISDKRVEEVIELTGLESVADQRAGGFSLGMGQRLGIATALLGDPKTLILDEPVNGLDPEGVLWIRKLLQYLASQGRTVLLSSHLMAEMAQTAHHLIVLGRGRVIADAPVQDIISRMSARRVRVRTPQATQLAALFAQRGLAVTTSEPTLLEVTGVEAAEVGELAAGNGWVLHELTPLQNSLEDVYMGLTAGEVEYRTGQVGAAEEAGK